MLERNAHSDELGKIYSKRDYITRTDIIYFLQRYVSTITAMVLAMTGVATAYVLCTTPIYTARTLLLIDAKTPILQLRENSTETSAALDSSQVESQIALLQSNEIATRVVDAQKLWEDPEFNPRPKDEGFAMLLRVLGRAAPLLPAAEEEPRSYAVRKLHRGVAVRRIGASYVLEVAFSSPDREKATRLSNAITDAYLQDIIETRSRAARVGSEWLEDRVAELRTQMNTAARRVQEFKASQDYRIQRRAGLGGQQPHPVGPASAAEQERTLEELESTALTYRKIYENFYLAFTEAVQKESYPVSNARVITPALTARSHPKTLPILSLGALLGGLLGFGLALIRHSMAQPVRSAQQIRNEIGLECLGLVPQLNVRATAPFAVRAISGIWRIIGGQEQIRPDYPLTEVLNAPFSAFTDELKRVKTAISLASQAHPLHCIGITSCMPGEGKTTLAANLASLVAASAGRTLLIDADVRTSRLSRALAPGAERGLLEVLEHRAETADCILPIKSIGADLLPMAGQGIPPTGVDILGSQMAELIKNVGESYAMVIVDLPPLRPVADALAMSAMLNGVIVVAEWDKTPLPDLTETIHSLRIARVGVIGIILTKVSPRAQQGFARRLDYRYEY